MLPMNLEQVNILQIQPAQTVVHGVKDMLARKTVVINVSLVLDFLLGFSKGPEANVFLNSTRKHLSSNNNLSSWKIVFLDRLPQNRFTNAVGIRVCCKFAILIKTIPVFYRKLTTLALPVSKKLIPASYAFLINGRDSSSSITQLAQRLSPYDMHPRQILETRTPVLPMFTYCIFGSSEVIVSWERKKLGT